MMQPAGTPPCANRIAIEVTWKGADLSSQWCGQPPASRRTTLMCC